MQVNTRTFLSILLVYSVIGIVGCSYITIKNPSEHEKYLTNPYDIHVEHTGCGSVEPETFQAWLDKGSSSEKDITSFFSYSNELWTALDYVFPSGNHTLTATAHVDTGGWCYILRATDRRDFEVGEYGLPDLVVIDFEVTGPVTCDWLREKAYVPVRVVIQNLGQDQANSFNVEIEQSWDEETFVSVCFRDPEHSDPDPSAPDWCYPSMDESLSPEGTVTFTGEVTAYNIMPGPFFLRAKADSGYCGVIPPNYCRVQEIDEDNNTSESISVSCPK